MPNFFMPLSKVIRKMGLKAQGLISLLDQHWTPDTEKRGNRTQFHSFPKTQDMRHFKEKKSQHNQGQDWHTGHQPLSEAPSGSGT